MPRAAARKKAASALAGAALENFVLCLFFASGRVRGRLRSPLPFILKQTYYCQ